MKRFRIIGIVVMSLLSVVVLTGAYKPALYKAVEIYPDANSQTSVFEVTNTSGVDTFTINKTSGAASFSGAVTVGSSLTVTGTLTAPLTASTVTLTGGTINGTTIGATTATTGAFTTLTGTNATFTNATTTTALVNGGAINATTVGSTTPAAGAFTTIAASSKISANGDMDIGNSTADTCAVLGVFKPRRASQLTFTTDDIAAGEVVLWYNTTLSKLYIVYRDATAGIASAELAAAF